MLYLSDTNFKILRYYHGIFLAYHADMQENVLFGSHPRDFEHVYGIELRHDWFNLPPPHDLLLHAVVAIS